MGIRTIAWVKGSIRIIDQTKLPKQLEYLDIKDLSLLCRAIKELRVRGAPALGAAAALGCYIGVKNSKAKDPGVFLCELERVIRFIGSSRPTARNLFWGLERSRRVALENRDKDVSSIKQLLLKEAQAVI
mgnify:CR=1 FL=1